MNIIDTKEERSEQSNPTKAVEFPVKQRLIRIRLVMEMTGISKSYIYQLVKEKEFPKPVKLTKGSKAVAWIESEVQEWVESRIAERDEVA